MPKGSFIPHYWNLIGAFPKDFLDGFSLIFIVPLCPGGMSIDVVNSIKGQFSICQCSSHRHNRSNLYRLSQMTAISTGTVALYFCKDGNSATERMTFRFDNQYTGAF